MCGERGVPRTGSHHHPGSLLRERDCWFLWIILSCMLCMIPMRGNADCTYLDMKDGDNAETAVSDAGIDSVTCPYQTDGEGSPLSELTVQQEVSANTTWVASYELDSPQNITHFSFAYYEWNDNEGSGIRLLNAQKGPELGIFTANNELGVEDEADMRPIHGGPGYNVWIRVDMRGYRDLLERRKVRCHMDKRERY